MERQGALFTGVCSQDGCGQAPRDGFMAFREKGILSQNMLLNIRDNQVNFMASSRAFMDQKHTGLSRWVPQLPALGRQLIDPLGRITSRPF